MAPALGGAPLIPGDESLAAAAPPLAGVRQRRLVRGGFVAVALGLFWLLLLAAAAGVGFGQPWSSPHALSLDGADVHTVFGSAQREGDSLRVEALGAQALGLQTWKVSLQADDYDLVRYDFRGLPRSLNIDLVFRQAAHPQDVVTVTLPAPAVGGGAYDLRDIPQWAGRITELGFSEYPDPQLVPENVPVAPFVLRGARLEQRSWLGGLRLLASHWLGYRPWRQSSINSLDEDDAASLWPIVPVAALGALGALVVLIWIGGLRARRALVIVVVGAWLLLDAHWLLRLAQRHTQTTAAYAGKTWPQRRQFQSDRELVDAAIQIKHVLAGVPTTQHVLLWASDSFVRGRLGYHLRPLNVGVWVPSAARLAALGEGTLLVVVDRNDQWRFDTDKGVLSGAGGQVAAQRLWHGGGVSLYRVIAEAKP